MCGYLTFPKEKLDVIRRKNEMKRNLIDDPDLSGSVTTLNPPSVQMKQESDGNSTPGSDNHLKVEAAGGHGTSKKRRTAIKIRHRNNGADKSKATLQMNNLRAITYQKALKIVTDETRPQEEGDLAAFKLWADGEEFPFWDDPIDTQGSPKLQNLGDGFSGSSEYVDNLLRSPNFDEFSPSLSGQNLESTSNSSSSHAVANLTETTTVESKRQRHLSNASSTQLERPYRTGRMLPNASMKPTSFRIQIIPKNLQNNMLQRMIKKVREGKFDLKSVSNEGIVAMARPVWTEQQVHEFWVYVFHQAAMLNIYFRYFIDKSVNVLVRASEAVVNGDIDFASLPSSFSGCSTPSDILDCKDIQFNFFYTREDLHKLTCKAYVTYGRVIRELRESINKYHAEYPAKISLYSSWSCYISLDPDYDTFCLMFQGTLLLIRNVLLDVSSILDISPALRQEIMIINNFVGAAKIPDFRFDVVRELAENFRKFQAIVNGFISSYEKGRNFDDDLVKVLKDPIFRHDCHELGKFLVKLDKFYYSKFVEINRHYQATNNLPQDTNWRFVSPKLVFELCCEWLRIYPGDKMSLNSQNNPLKKTLYLFYHALAKCLAHVFTPTKCVLVVDLCNIMFTKVGVQFAEFDRQRRPIYASIEPLAIELVKTIKFFETRLCLYGFQLESSNMLNSQFIAPVETTPPSLWTYRDIVELKPAKESVHEVQLSNFGQQYLNVENYPLFPRIQNEPTSVGLIQKEIERQFRAIKNEPFKFDYATGTLNHDFDASAVVNLFSQVRAQELRGQALQHIQSVRDQNNELLRSRNVVKSAINGIGQ